MLFKIKKKKLLFIKQSLNKKKPCSCKAKCGYKNII